MLVMVTAAAFWLAFVFQALAMVCFDEKLNPSVQFVRLVPPVFRMVIAPWNPSGHWLSIW